MQTTRSMSGEWWRKASTTGERGRASLRPAAVKAGVSLTSRRMIQPAMMTTKLRMKGMRQPQLLNCSVGM